MKKHKQDAPASALRSLRLTMAESAVTAGLLAMSVFTPFFNSIGLNNQQISEVQIYFTIVLILLNVPMGYIQTGSAANGPISSVILPTLLYC